MNVTESKRVDGVEEFVEGVMVLDKVDIWCEDYEKVGEEGGMKLGDIEGEMKGEIE